MKFRQLQVVQLLKDGSGVNVRDVMNRLECSRPSACAALLQLHKSGSVERKILPIPGAMNRYTYYLKEDRG